MPVPPLIVQIVGDRWKARVAKTTQDSFHPLMGHMEDGTVIAMRDGDTLVLKAVMRGWQLFDGKGRPFGLPTPSAHVIAALVTAHPSEEL